MAYDAYQDNKNVVTKYRSDNILHDDFFKISSKVEVNPTGVEPLKIDNRQLCSPTDYQGDKPYCVGYSVAQLLEAIIWKYEGKLKNIDAAQIYAKAKEKDNQMDVGGTYVDLGLNCGLKILDNQYIKDKFTVKTMRNSDPAVIKRIIHKSDFAIAGFTVNEGWYEADWLHQYMIPDIGRNIGGHAVLICGYDPSGIYIQNHWGISWGAKGFAILPWNLYRKQLMQICWLEEKK